MSIEFHAVLPQMQKSLWFITENVNSFLTQMLKYLKQVSMDKGSMTALLLHSDFLARCLETGTDCSLFKVNIDREEQMERKKNKDIYLCGKRGSGAALTVAYQNSCSARGRK